MVRYFKFWGFSLLLLSISQLGIAQKSTVASGGEATGTTGTVSFTVGLVDYVTINSTSVTVSQGVQQAYEIFVIANITPPKQKLKLTLYPNPTTNFVTLCVDSLDTNKFSYKLYDILGKQLLLKPIDKVSTDISMENLPTATYFITIFNDKGILRTYKVIKH